MRRFRPRSLSPLLLGLACLALLAFPASTGREEAGPYRQYAEGERPGLILLYADPASDKMGK